MSTFHVYLESHKVIIQPVLLYTDPQPMSKLFCTCKSHATPNCRGWKKSATCSCYHIQQSVHALPHQPSPTAIGLMSGAHHSLLLFIAIIGFPPQPRTMTLKWGAFPAARILKINLKGKRVGRVMLTTCGSDAGHMWERCWPHVGGMLATCGSDAGHMWEGCWPHVGVMLATCGRDADHMWEGCWPHVGGMLATCGSDAGHMWE